MESITIESLLLNDLLFEHNNTYFQIDSLLILQEIIHLFEVKNYEHDYYIEKEKWYTFTGKEIKNPLLQLNRNASLLRRILHDLGIYLPIKEHLVFVNPDFYLYQVPINLPIIFPSQIERFIININKKPSNLTNHHTKIANQLLSLHLSESPFMRLPNYSFEQLKKGIICCKCRSFIDHYEKYFLLHSPVLMTKFVF
ncbi:nuclease-related domain-containing protein [Heyndrickxia vini]|uniref:NERD domain-containing protein n=1 Tax=Heyndrickxia vini TaxID=1476025 RepID=A0ABX7E525_9BACI|nr:nuclease-related domain-containing protein [Heyndrickxia vini]QQZ10345.1 NERD domain-containing protein [Heyndrickxia vini]